MTPERKALAELVAATEYHVEQTRPIERTSLALNAARAVLAQPEAQAVLLTEDEITRLYFSPCTPDDLYLAREVERAVLAKQGLEVPSVRTE